VKLLTPGIVEMEKRLRIPCVGVIPYIPDLGLDEEDSVSLESRDQTSRSAGWTEWEREDRGRKLRIAVVALPYLSNFTDFDTLAAEPGVALRFIQTPQELERADVIILPGSKQTIQDFHWLQDSGLANAIVAHRQLKLIIGICGGMQMLGLAVEDPHGMESGGEIKGLGLVAIRTVMSKDKITAQVSARLISDRMFGVAIDQRETAGYEIHLGETSYLAGAQPLFELRRSHASHPVIHDGAQSEDGRIWGTYVHGLFDGDSFRHALLRNARLACQLEPCADYAFVTAERQNRIDRLADCVESALDMDNICEWINVPALHSGVRSGR